MSGSGLAEGARWIPAGLFVVVHALLTMYAAHRAWLLWQWSRTPAEPSDPPPPGEWPVVTVQLPIYEERHVVERLVDAACALDYPADRLEIQILDDSADETTALAAARAARHRAVGADVRVLHRDRRDGHKAGALAGGLARARGELIAVFDADFVPSPDFLRRAVPHFADPHVGMVQARWGHANRNQSWLTAGQAIALDAHFRIEQRARAAAGRFFNFNGTAGVWRRACIDSAGGWSSETLTEDLDLSYRAQLAGWRFRYLDGVEAAGDLPVDVWSLRRQQHRWAKGAMQTARKLLPRVWASDAPFPVKADATFHLTGNVTYALVLAVASLLPAALLLPPEAGPWPIAWHVASLAVTASAWSFFVAAARAGGVGWGRALAGAPLVVVLGMGLAWSQTLAVFEGWRRPGGRWDRTPKYGSLGAAGRWRTSVYARASTPAGWIEAGGAVACAALVWLACAQGAPAAAFFAALLGAGSAWVAALSLWDGWALGRLAGGGRREELPRLPPLTEV